ncbi:hypothetical protein ACVIGB_008994 [Bradyrhizobium sp. USDA 4341]
MAPASWSTSIAHPRIVRIAGLRSLVISIGIAPDTANRFVRHSFRLLTQGWDFNGGSSRLEVQHAAVNYPLQARLQWMAKEASRPDCLLSSAE